MFAPQEARGGWHSLASARAEWLDAPYEDSQLTDLLDVAREQCLQYGPHAAWTDPGQAPTRYRMAQLLQARNLWNATKKDDGGGVGADGFSVTVFPMDWTVKNLLRPKRGIPGMF